MLSRPQLALAAAPLATLAFACLPASASAHACAGADRPAVGTPTAALRNAVRCLVNHQREAHHLPPLQADRRLDRSAQRWTNHLVATHSFTHGARFAARISAFGFNWQMAGENIATGFETPREVVAGWMGSTGHCRNILDPDFASTGIGVSPRASGQLRLGATWTQDFALSMTQRAPSQNWAPASACPYR